MTKQAGTQLRSSFLSTWVIANAVGLTIAGIAYAFFGSWPFIMIGAITGITLGAAASGILVGVIVGTAQWLVLQRYLRTSIWWIGTSSVGWALVGITLWGMKIPTMTDVGITGFSSGSNVIQWAIAGAVLGLTTSIMQILMLPLRGNSIGLWLFFNTIGWAMALAISWPIALSTHLLLLGPIGCIAGALGGTISGIALTKSFRDPAQLKPQSSTQRSSEPIPSQSGKSSNFTASDRIGGIGLFGIAFSLLAVAIGNATLGTILLVGGGGCLAYSVITRRRS